MAHPGIDVIRQLLGDTRSAPTVDLVTRRADLAALAGSPPAPDGIEVVPIELGGLRAERLQPAGAPDDELIVYFHGGGYCCGSIDTHRGLGGALAEAAGRTVVMVDYRLAPEDPFPAAVHDALEAFDDLAPARIALAGDSAGGGLTVAAALALRDRGEAQPVALACLSPWVDLTQTAPSYDSVGDLDPMVSREGLQQMADAYVGEHEAREPLVSPLFADLAGLPPLRIEVGTAEVLLDDSTTLAERAAAAGVSVTLEVWPEMIHVFQAFPPELVPEAAASIEATAAFLVAHLAP
jgi:acetyl esterase/lipase